MVYTLYGAHPACKGHVLAAQACVHLTCMCKTIANTCTQKHKECHAICCTLNVQVLCISTSAAQASVRPTCASYVAGVRCWCATLQATHAGNVREHEMLVCVTLQATHAGDVSGREVLVCDPAGHTHAGIDD